MENRWILTPQFFEQHEPALEQCCPPDAMLNGPMLLPDREPESMAMLHGPIADFTATALTDGVRPVSVAGDCCAAVPVLAGLQRAGVDATLVWIDAHGDFNTPETSPSQFLGGMPLAMMAGRGPQWMCEAVGADTLAEERIWLIDGRDLDPLERAALDASAVRRTGMAGLASLGIDGPVWVHLDMDVLDCTEIPAFNYPVEGGPTLAEAEAACQRFAAANRVAAISVSGWTGALDRDGAAAGAATRLLSALTA